jgi:hypothetical protein
MRVRELHDRVVCVMATLTGVVRDHSRLFWWRLDDEG